MAITWTRETVENTSAPVLGFTGAQAYNFFAALVDDISHTRYSNTTPYTDWFTEHLNSAIQIIHSHSPSRKEIIYCTSSTSVGIYSLPDYIATIGHVQGVYYDSAYLKRDDERAIREGLISGLTFDSFLEDGTPLRWCDAGDRAFRIVPRPSAAGTIKVMAYTMPPALTTATLSSAIDLPAHLKTAAPRWIAAIAAARDGLPDAARMHLEAFYRMLNQKMSDNYESSEPLDISDPSYKYHIPGYNGGNSL